MHPTSNASEGSHWGNLRLTADAPLSLLNFLPFRLELIVVSKLGLAQSFPTSMKWDEVSDGAFGVDGASHHVDESAM